MKDKEMPDPQQFVDAFSHRVGEWQEWYEKWKRAASQGEGLPGENSVRAYDPWEVRRLDYLTMLLDLQQKVNVMLLAAIDDLNARVDKSSEK